MTSDKKSLLFVSHKGQSCGVHDYGKQIAGHLKHGDMFRVDYIELGSRAELDACLAHAKPDVIVYNYHPDIMAWIHDGIPEVPHAVQIAIFHEICQEQEHLHRGLFHYLLAPDPTLRPYNPNILRVPRIVPPLVTTKTSDSDTIVVGSFGFNTPSKNFPRIPALVSHYYDNALIRLHVTKHDFLDPDGVELDKLKEECFRAATKPGIKLEFTHDFLSANEILQFLSENTINLFLYEDTAFRGISSTVDYALSVDRPIGVSGASMFRHVLECNPTICVDDTPLPQIVRNGTASLAALKRSYHPSISIPAWENAILRCWRMHTRSRAMPDGKGFNELLDANSCELYRRALRKGPALSLDETRLEMLAADPHQAFAFDTVCRLSEEIATPRLLVIEPDDALVAEVLKAAGYKALRVSNSSPADLDHFFALADRSAQLFDMIVAVDPFRYVLKDRDFLSKVARSLAPGGIAISTVVLRRQLMEQASKLKKFTAEELRRAVASLPDCRLIDDPVWGPEYRGQRTGPSKATPASLVFEKFPFAAPRIEWSRNFTQQTAASQILDVMQPAVRRLQSLAKRLVR